MNTLLSRTQGTENGYGRRPLRNLLISQNYGQQAAPQYQQQAQTRFTDPAAVRAVANGVAYKPTLDGSTEYYSGPNENAYIMDYMTRNGFGRAIRAMFGY